MTWVLEQCPEHVPPQARLVLISIANHANAQGENAWPAIGTIGRETGLSPDQARRWVRWLEKDGLVKVRANAGGTVDTRSDRRPNLYSLPKMGRGGADATPSSNGVASTPSRGGTDAANDLAPMQGEPSLEPSIEREVADEVVDDEPPLDATTAKVQIARAKRDLRGS